MNVKDDFFFFKDVISKDFLEEISPFWKSK